MRDILGLGVTLVFLAGGCDGSQSSLTGMSAVEGNPRFFSSAATPATVTKFEDRYFIEAENFPLCGGGYAYGDITWHEIDVWITTPGGVLRAFYELNIANGGRATGPDGTEYIVQQVNQGPFIQQPGQPPDYYGRFGHRQMRIMLISPGSGDNFFYTKDEDGPWTGVCRG